jgi:hypothetical protein
MQYVGSVAGMAKHKYRSTEYYDMRWAVIGMIDAMIKLGICYEDVIVKEVNDFMDRHFNETL